MAAFDPLRTTAGDIQALLSKGTLNCFEVVEVYLRQIDLFGHELHAVIQTTPRELLQKRASELDVERKNGKIRGPLHGIPVLLKDNINTHPSLGLGTTCGSFALMHTKPKENAPLVDGLLQAGAIILGKANLSEFAWVLGDTNPCGWSAVGGQTQSAYVKHKWEPSEPCSAHSNPGGSSSGSAVSVSAGFAPISIGTETGGSLVMPANRAALYTMKPSIGLVSQSGIVPISDLCDAAGPMTMNVADLAHTLDAIADPAHPAPKGGYSSALTSTWDGLRIGCLDPKDWPLDERTVGKDENFVQQQLHDINTAYQRLQKVVSDLKLPVSLISHKNLDLEDGNPLFDMWKFNLNRLMNEYLKSLDHSPVKTLEEIVAFNKGYHFCELPPGINQDYLERAVQKSWTDEQSARAIAHCRRIAREDGFDKTMNENNIDIIVGPADSSLSLLVAAAGYPIATLPLTTYEGNGRPFGLVAVARQSQEALLIRVMSAWEATFPGRAIPKMEETMSPSQAWKGPQIFT